MDVWCDMCGVICDGRSEGVCDSGDGWWSLGSAVY